ncbi:hypothetical protein K435DRAFT_822386 [Dendrothele bispora CBS 962.96]|uniref:MYND-type domain-containing protein n=1 Tax=Dendrothele bispora (strain CBS 962.96) TaxID=1314807 RepID=A0A4S8LAH7_DENBC|nr:hypothetical protein K435DRAFT_822386 [Dendrothele bispora CBS 962.96]
MSSGAALFQKAEQFYSSGRTDDAFEYYQKAIKKILKDEVVDAKLPVVSVPVDSPLETLGFLWQNFTGFFRDASLTYNEKTAPEAWKLLCNFRIGNTHKCHSRFRTPRQKILLKGMQITANMSIGLLAWDTRDRATAAKRYAEAIKLARTHPPFDCLGDKFGKEKPNEEVAKTTKNWELFVAKHVKETKENLLTLIGNDIWNVGIAKALDEIAETGNVTGAGLRKESMNIIPMTRVEGDGTVNIVQNVVLATDGCARCGKRDVKLQRCSGCLKIAYCGRDCQTADWKNHKTVCAKKSKQTRTA